MTLSDIKSSNYCVSGLDDFTLDQALRLWKAKFETIKHFKRDVIRHPALQALDEFVTDMWEDIIPVSVEEAFQEQNMERRRVMFDCIGVVKLFQQLKPLLLDRQVIPKRRTRWDDKNRSYEVTYDDTYELYQLEGHQLFSESRRSFNDAVFAVRCWCTTTKREYWIYVPREAALAESGYLRDTYPDAIRAIAWTIRIDITAPKRILRQGDIILVEESEDSKETVPYHLSKEQYLSLLYSET